MFDVDEYYNTYLDNFLSDYPDVFTISDICEVLRVGRSDCYKWLKNHKVKSRKDGSSYTVCKEFIKEYLWTDGYTINREYPTKNNY